MPADGLGLQTTIAQSGLVAKTQAKGQPAQQPTAPFSDKVDPGKDTHVERLKRGEAADRGQVESDRREGKRRRRRGGQGPSEAPGGAEAAAGREEGAPDPEALADAEAEKIGRIVDCRA